eukprot:PhM_4_TR9266/c0_g1_i1/m.28439
MRHRHRRVARPATHFPIRRRPQEHVAAATVLRRRHRRHGVAESRRNDRHNMACVVVLAGGTGHRRRIGRHHPRGDGGTTAPSRARRALRAGRRGVANGRRRPIHHACLGGGDFLARYLTRRRDGEVLEEGRSLAHLVERVQVEAFSHPTREVARRDNAGFGDLRWHRGHRLQIPQTVRQMHKRGQWDRRGTAGDLEEQLLILTLIPPDVNDGVVDLVLKHVRRRARFALRPERGVPNARDERVHVFAGVSGLEEAVEGGLFCFGVGERADVCPGTIDFCGRHVKKSRKGENYTEKKDSHNKVQK